MEEELNDVISQFGDMAGDAGFNPEDFQYPDGAGWDYTMEAGMSIYPNEGGEEMPTYSVDELKMDIEPMLLDLDMNQVTELTSWIFQTWYQMQIGGNDMGYNMPMPMEGEMDIESLGM